MYAQSGTPQGVSHKVAKPAVDHMLSVVDS